MSFLPTNLIILRLHRKLSCTFVADTVGIHRSTLSAYENGINEPSATNLVILANFYRVTTDRLCKQDMRTLRPFHLGQLERGYDKISFLNGDLTPYK